MKRFKPLDHPSDVGIIAYGKSREEIFENAAYGMFSLMADLEKVEPRQKLAIKAEADDIEALLINWLNELIFHEDTDKMIFKEFKVTKLTGKLLEATVSGERIDLKRHSFSRPIKAATYNQLEIGADHARVVFDV
jgi:SHS2 domain-containing protein